MLRLLFLFVFGLEFSNAINVTFSGSVLRPDNVYLWSDAANWKPRVPRVVDDVFVDVSILFNSTCISPPPYLFLNVSVTIRSLSIINASPLPAGACVTSLVLADGVKLNVATSVVMQSVPANSPRLNQGTALYLGFASVISCGSFVAQPWSGIAGQGKVQAVSAVMLLGRIAPGYNGFGCTCLQDRGFPRNSEYGDLVFECSNCTAVTGSGTLIGVKVANADQPLNRTNTTLEQDTLTFQVRTKN